MLKVRLSNVARKHARHLHGTAVVPTSGHNAFIPQPRVDVLGPYEPAASSKNVKSGRYQLQGRQIAIKDNICTSGTATTCASQLLEGFLNPIDSTIVKHLRAAGADILENKTNMDEFGMGSYSMNSRCGPVKLQEHDGTEYSAGGSSGGSAAAVAARDCWAAIGTDTGGSVRLPAAYTGTFGFKPSYGMISRNGVVAYANSLDTVGIIADTTSKIQKIFQTTSQYDHKDPTSTPLRTRKAMSHFPNRIVSLGRELRVGIPMEYNIDELNGSIRHQWNLLAVNMQKLGMEIIPVSLPTTKSAISAYYVLAPAEASSNLARYDGVRYGNPGPGTDAADGTLYSKRRGAHLGEEVKRRILLGTYTLSSEAMDNYFIRAQKVRRLVQRDFDRVFYQDNVLHDQNSTGRENGIDVLLCPTASNYAPKLVDVHDVSSVHTYMTDIFTVPASLAGLPAISVPTPNSDGPETNVGLQVIGQYGSDALVLDVAHTLERNGLVKDSLSSSQELKEWLQGPAKQTPDAFSRELAEKYTHMRYEYGGSMKAVQWNPTKNM